MEKIISYPLSLIAIVLFLITLLIFHPIQWVCLNWFGYQAHKKSVDYLNGILLRIAHLLGATYRFENRDLIPKNVPIIFVANHQSLYDIIGMIWFLRKSHPKFVSKKELAKGIPSVSYNLRHGGAAIIDRKDPKQAISEIKKLGEYINNNNRSAAIFPEGTRSKNGVPKKFAETGLKILCKTNKNGYIVPITINNSWKFTKFGAFPFGLGCKMQFIVHKPMAISDFSFEELIEKTEKIVIESINY